MTGKRFSADGGEPPSLLERVVVPVAGPNDARATARGLARYGPDVGEVLVVNVIEKAGGAPDKASVEQREDHARHAFEVFREMFGGDAVDSEIRYDTDVADAVFAAGDEVDATAIAFSPRGGSRWLQLLTGDVTMDLVTETDRPVLVLPDVDPDR